ncbi:phytanoyl-CoA dioxygenase family protein [Mesorhizobium sp. A623]
MARDDLDVRVEELRLLGYTTLDSGLSELALDKLSGAFDRAEESYRQDAVGKGIDLVALDERDTIRLLPVIAPGFWELVFNERLHQLLSQILGDYYILNQANGLVNRANAGRYSQAAYHRDLPYQHFVCSRPIAINALFAMDEFTIENGATRVIPASHTREAFPSDGTVRRNEKQVTVPRGTFIVLDCMAYHAGSTNRSSANRRAVNHVFTIPMLRQQLHLPSTIGDANAFTDWQRRILGFGLDEYRSIDEWFASRSGKA